eukprot:scaffold74457_cov74-Phaeocystis_antarctica.AAC.2
MDPPVTMVVQDNHSLQAYRSLLGWCHDSGGRLGGGGGDDGGDDGGGDVLGAHIHLCGYGTARGTICIATVLHLTAARGDSVAPATEENAVHRDPENGHH